MIVNVKLFHFQSDSLGIELVELVKSGKDLANGFSQRDSFL